MKIEYREGNLFEGTDVDFLIHCCNSQGRMGSGFAKELRARYSGAYEIYEQTHRVHGLKTGQIVPYNAPDGRTIFNLIGQRNYGYDGKRYVSYDGLAEGFEALDTIAVDLGMSTLFMPVIGCDLAGGKWSIVSSIIETHSQNYQPVVYLLPGKNITDY
jgi:O-acetyl-ADP-ribose deacetylase (regulator of RNase III)